MEHAAASIVTSGRTLAVANLSRPARQSTAHPAVNLRLQRRSHTHVPAAAGSSASAPISRVQPFPDPFPAVGPGEDLPADYGEPKPNPPKHRRAGVVLHPTSLPGPYGIGEIGAEAKAFVDWLVEAGMQLWQLLPLVPPETSYWSPYSSLDGLCGNTLLIPLDELAQLGLLEPGELPEPQPPSGGIVHADFDAVAAAKVPLLDKAAARLCGGGARFASLAADMEAFREANPWVEQSALFSILTHLPGCQGKAWWDWPAELRDRQPAALERVRQEHAADIDRFIALQFLFDKFWSDVKAYANSRGVRLVGDMPIYVGGHSADVWASRHLFELTADGKPLLVSGVPPDAFAATGQLWGSPLYDWKAQKEDGYRWWVQRFKRSMALYDETRVDHFRAFAGYWAVEAWRETAMIGTWKKGPMADLFLALEAALGEIPILAEDLGVITPDVVALRQAIGAPGMIVLQFAWGGGPTNTHLPHNIYENCFVYPGTHDNHTTIGWWQHEAQAYERKLIRDYTGMSGEDVAWTFIIEAYKSVARTAVVTLQDIMRLDDRARMNTPGRAEGNWTWRAGGSDVWRQLAPEAAELRAMAHMYDRLAPGAPRAAPGGRSGMASFR